MGSKQKGPVQDRTPISSSRHPPSPAFLADAKGAEQMR